MADRAAINDDDATLTGRVRRYAQVGTAVGGLAARYAGGRVFGLDLAVASTRRN